MRGGGVRSNVARSPAAAHRQRCGRLVQRGVRQHRYQASTHPKSGSQRNRRHRPDCPEQFISPKHRYPDIGCARSYQLDSVSSLKAFKQYAVEFERCRADLGAIATGRLKNQFGCQKSARPAEAPRADCRAGGQVRLPVRRAVSTTSTMPVSRFVKPFPPPIDPSTSTDMIPDLPASQERRQRSERFRKEASPWITRWAANPEEIEAMAPPLKPACWPLPYCFDLFSRAPTRSDATRSTCLTSSNRVSGRLLKSMSR